MKNRVFRVPPMPIEVTPFLADHSHWPNAAFGRMMKMRFSAWQREHGRWVRRSSIPEPLREQIFARDGLQCSYCDDVRGPFEIDHIIPVAENGDDNPENLCVACRLCNRMKGAKSLEEF